MVRRGIKEKLEMIVGSRNIRKRDVAKYTILGLLPDILYNIGNWYLGNFALPNAINNNISKVYYQPSENAPKIPINVSSDDKKKIVDYLKRTLGLLPFSYDPGDIISTAIQLFGAYIMMGGSASNSRRRKVAGALYWFYGTLRKIGKGLRLYVVYEALKRVGGYIVRSLKDMSGQVGYKIKESVINYWLSYKLFGISVNGLYNAIQSVTDPLVSLVALIAGMGGALYFGKKKAANRI